MMPEPVERAWIAALPKAEVHLHLEGCIDAHLVRRAAARHGVSTPVGSGDGSP